MHYLLTSRSLLPENFSMNHLRVYSYPDWAKELIYKSCRPKPSDRLSIVSEQIFLVGKNYGKAYRFDEKSR